MKPKFGIIGCGNICRFHFAGLQKAGIKIVHIADLNENSIRPYVDRFNTRFSTDYREVLVDPEVTVVSVLTSGRYHKEICIAALEAGKDVICEKTMTDNAEEAREVVRAVQVSKRLFFTAYMKRFFPAVQKARELLPRLGRLFSAHVRTYQQWGNFYETSTQGDKSFVLDTYGGAVLKCAGSHMIDLTLHFLGRPQSLYAHTDYLEGSYFDRKVTSLFEYSSGLVVSFEAATHPLTKIGYERNSWDEWIEINGVGGQLKVFTTRWDTPDHNPALLIHYDNSSETSTEYRFDAVNPFDIELAYFADCLEKREQGRPDVIDGFNVDVLIEAMNNSTQKRAAVSLDYKGL